MAIAHTRNSAGLQQDLVDHLQRVADMAARFVMPFGAEKLAYCAGILHDIGKFDAAFQQYLLEAESNPTSLMRGPDHKGAGATLAGRLQLDALAFLVAGHHGGLVASSKLKEWLKERAADPAVQQAIVAAQAAATAANIRIAFLPFRAPELMPCEDLWRLAKAVVAANRVYEAVQEQAERAVAWLAALTPFDRLLKSGLFGTKFQWLGT